MSTMFACFVSAVVTTIVWLTIFASRGFSGAPLIEGVTLAILAGIVAGWALSVSIKKRKVVWIPIMFALVLMLCPFVIFIAYGGETRRPEAGDGNPAADASTLPTLPATGQIVEERPGDFVEATNKFGQDRYDEGRKNRSKKDYELGRRDAYRQPTPMEIRDQPNPCIRRLDPYNTVITFTVPGCIPVIDTELATDPGVRYKMKTVSRIRGLRIGTLENGANLTPMPASEDDLNQRDGHLLWGVPRSTGKTMAIIIDDVPNGTYQIDVRQSVFSLRSGEISPGVFTDKPVLD